MVKKFVLTGGPCAGKTTVLDMFSRENFNVVPEAAIIVIEELNKRFGVEGQKKWRKDNQVLFLEKIIEKENELEAAAEKLGSEIIVCDRGKIDWIGYLDFMKLAPTQKILDAVSKHDYTAVFILATIKDYKQRAETGRIYSYEDSTKIRDCIMDAYTKYGYNPVLVEVMSPKERFEFIKSKIK